MLFLRLMLVISSLLTTQYLTASETPKKRPRSSFKTPNSDDRRLSKKEKQKSYDDLQIPTAFKDIVDFYDGNELKQSQLKLLGSELWSPSNISNPNIILTGSLAQAFWYCTFEEECEDFLENRSANDIDVLVDDLGNHSYILIDDLEREANIVREEKVIQYFSNDRNIFSYDFILTGKKGIDFGSINDLYKNDSHQYIPVLGLEKLLELKKIAGLDLKFGKHKQDIEILKKIILKRAETENLTNTTFRYPPTVRRNQEKKGSDNRFIEFPQGVLLDFE